MEPSLLSQSVWLSLPQETRAKLVVLFGMPPKGNVNVVWGPEGAKVMTDGYGYEHLKLITLEKLQEIVGDNDDNFYRLFRYVVENIDDISSGAVIVKDVENVVKAEEKLIEDTKNLPKKKGGRPKGSKNRTNETKTA